MQPQPTAQDLINFLAEWALQEITAELPQPKPKPKPKKP